MFTFSDIKAALSSWIYSDAMTDLEFLEQELNSWKTSAKRQMQIKGRLYYEGKHDILKRQREVIGASGELEPVYNLPNAHIVDNQYGKLVSQKANYLTGRPITFDGDNAAYIDKLKELFNKGFLRLLKNVTKAAYCSGIAWIYPGYDKNGEFTFRLFPGYEVLPFWADSEHTILDMAVRLYEVNGYKGKQTVTYEKVEVYSKSGIDRYILDGGHLKPDLEAGETNSHSSYVLSDAQPEQGLNWSRIPLIAFKANESEIPLLSKVKALQDALNLTISNFQNAMEEDPRNTVLVLKNYDGENLGEFRKNLATYGAVKVRTGDGGGGVDSLRIEVNSENYKTIMALLKKAIIENGMGYDAKDDRLNGNPNQMNIQSMYSDIDLDANETETEFQAAFEQLLWFVRNHLKNTGQGAFGDAQAEVIFNRDMLMNEGEIIANCAASVGLLSKETIVSQHPWVNDVQEELERIDKEAKEAAYDPFGGVLAGEVPPNGSSPDEEEPQDDRTDRV